MFIVNIGNYSINFDQVSFWGPAEEKDGNYSICFEFNSGKSLRIGPYKDMEDVLGAISGIRERVNVEVERNFELAQKNQAKMAEALKEWSKGDSEDPDKKE